MQRISSRLTILYVRIIPWILLGLLLISVILYIIFEFDFFIAFNVFILLILINWWFHIRKLKMVYLGDKKLKVENEIIPFNKIISVNKFIFSSTYRIKYSNNNELKSFTFLPKFHLPFFTQSYIKEIRKDIKSR